MNATETGASGGVKFFRPSGPLGKRAEGFRAFLQEPKAAAGLAIFVLYVLMAVLAPLIAPDNPQAAIYLPLQPPSPEHLLGTTSTGQDVFSQLAYGARTTLAVGVGAGAVASSLGLVIGMFAGYRGGQTDALLMAVTNIFLVLPTMALLIVIEYFMHNSTPLTNGAIIGMTTWAWGARVLRSQTLTLSRRDFVTAAKLSGASDLRILATEILPNLSSILAANVMYACLGAILAESGLAFLGLENLSSTSWGTMLYWADANGAMLGGAWWWFVPPGLSIALVGSSFALMNSAIDKITNPRLRVRRRKRDGRKYAGA